MHASCARPFVIVALALAAAAMTGTPAGGTPAGARPQAIGAQLIVGGLNDPAAFTIAPDGRIFYGEHATGQIRIYDPSGGTNSLMSSGRRGRHTR